MKKIKKGDQVVVLAGKDKGKTGKVLHMVAKGQRAIVEAVNMMAKHMKPNPQKEQEGGIIRREAPIHHSNLAILNPVSNKADRVGFKFIEGKKVRYFKSDDQLIDGVK